MKFSSREELSTFIKGEVRSAVKESMAPFVTTGPVGRDSAGYSVGKAAALAVGAVQPDQAKEEAHMSERLRATYAAAGLRPQSDKSVLVPIGSRLLPDSALSAEVRDMMAASSRGYDPDEERWLRNRVRPYGTKALGVFNAAAGGSLVNPPDVVGEFIDLQRNYEVFPNAGSTEVALLPDGTLFLPRLSGGATAHWAGEGSGFTASSGPTTGGLSLQAKKVGVRVEVNNEFLRRGGPTAEGMVKHDMARVAAVKADLAMLEGTGGTQIKGVITYSSIATHTASTTGTNGNTFQAADVALMDSKIADEVTPTAWVMRKAMYAALLNRRADAVSASDGKGPFLLRGTRYGELLNIPVVQSAQVSNTRVKNAGTTLTYILLGYFPDWVVARMGVMEFLKGAGDTALDADQTVLQGVQYLDAGARNPASFVFCDQNVVG